MRKISLVCLFVVADVLTYFVVLPAMSMYAYTTIGVLVGLVAGLLTAIGILSEGRESRFVVVIGPHGNAFMIGAAFVSFALGVVAGLAWPAVLVTGAAYWITRPNAREDEADDA